METTSPKVPQLAPEQILRAADCVELVWRMQSSEEDKAALATFHADGPELARLALYTSCGSRCTPHRTACGWRRVRCS